MFDVAVPCLIVLITVALGDGTEICHGRNGSGSELVCKVIAERHLASSCAAELFLPSGDLAVFQVGGVKLTEGAGWVVAIGEVIDGFQAVVSEAGEIIE